MDQYDRAVSLRRQKEANVDVKSKTTTLHLLSRWPIESCVMKFYTRKMFNRFQEEFRRTLDLEAKLDMENNTICTYHVSYYNGGRARKVELLLPDISIKCTCKRFEFTRILCAHILKVLRVRNVLDLHCRYLPKRWSKDAKSDVIVDNSGNTLEANTNGALSVRYSELSNMAHDVVKGGSISKALTEIARRGLKRV